MILEPSHGGKNLFGQPNLLTSFSRLLTKSIKEWFSRDYNGVYLICLSPSRNMLRDNYINKNIFYGSLKMFLRAHKEYYIIFSLGIWNNYGKHCIFYGELSTAYTKILLLKIIFQEKRITTKTELRCWERMRVERWVKICGGNVWFPAIQHFFSTFLYGRV